MKNKGTRTPVREKAKEIEKYIKKENPDYNYLRELFRQIRKNLNVTIDVNRVKKLPYVPTEEQISKYYDTVWSLKNMQHVVLIKTLLYTGIRVTELVNVEIKDVDLEGCQIRINKGKGSKDRIVPFPNGFREVLGLHISNAKEKKHKYLFESSWKKQYTDRGIRKILAKYTKLAGIEQSISPHKLRHFLFTWMKKQGVDDGLLQPYSGHESRKSLEIYSKLSLCDAQDIYEDKMREFPV